MDIQVYIKVMRGFQSGPVPPVVQEAVKLFISQYGKWHYPKLVSEFSPIFDAGELFAPSYPRAFYYKGVSITQDLWGNTSMSHAVWSGSVTIMTERGKRLGFKKFFVMEVEPPE